MSDILGCPVRLTPALDARLYNLLEDTNEVLSDVCQEVSVFKPQPGCEEMLWRWCLMLGVLMHDISTSAASLAFHDYRRALLIMRRLVFEYCIRYEFYRRHPDVAEQHILDYFPRADLFFRRLNDPATNTQFRAMIEQATQSQVKRSRNRWDQFEHMLADVMPQKADEWYAAYYMFPSALIHGEALSSLDLLEQLDDGSIKLHTESRRTQLNEIVFNLIWFVLRFEKSTVQAFHLRSAPRVDELDGRLNALAPPLGIVQDLGQDDSA
jgi:hypothetical protein